MRKAVILNDTSFESHHGCETVIKNIRELLLQNSIETIATNPVGTKWSDNISFINSMREADVVVVNGEGTLHHSQSRARELISVGRHVKETTNVPVVLINATYQDNNDEIADCMKYYDLVYVRESLSRHQLRGISIDATVVPDMSFYSTYNLSEKKKSGQIGVTDSVYVELSKKLHQLSVKSNYRYLPAKTYPRIRSANVRYFLRFIKFNLSQIIKYVLYKSNLISLKYESYRTLYYMRGYENYLRSIANSDFMIIGRYHSLCFSLKTLTPFFALKSNSHKIEGILSDIGIGQSRVIDEKDLGSLKVRYFTAEEEEKILEYVNSAPSRIRDMFADIKLLVEK